MEELYKNKIVCFIDILGFGRLVEDGSQSPDKIYSIISKLSRKINEWANVPIASGIDLQLTQFSDCIVFSFTPERHYFMTFNFFKELAISMVKDGVLLRGGITYGKIFHNEEFVFGPAMNKAYYLESKVAIYPKILIDESASNLKNDEGKKIFDYNGQFVFRALPNEYPFVDYVNDVSGYVNEHEYYARLKDLIIYGLLNQDEMVRNKYLWLKDEYNKANFIISNQNYKISPEPLHHS